MNCMSNKSLSLQKANELKLNRKKFPLKKKHQLLVLFPSLLLGISATVHATTVIDTDTTRYYTTDTDYVINSGQTVDAFSDDGHGGYDDVIIAGQVGATFTNNGIITRSGGQFHKGIALNFETAGNIINNGTIFGAERGVAVNSNGAGDVNLVNKGDISISGTQQSAILYTNTNGVIDNYGTISASASEGKDDDGIEVGGNSAVTINNYQGAVIGTGPMDLSDKSSNGIEILQAESTATINNDGEIHGNSAAVKINPGAGSVIVNNNATGIMTGSLYNTIYVISNSTVNNKGSITNDKNNAIEASGSNNTFINSGIINGGADKYAISLTGNDNSITLDTGSSLGGSTVINSTGNNNTLTLQGSGSEDGDIVGMSSLDVAAGSQWNLSGKVGITGTVANSINVAGGLNIDGKMDNSTGGTLVSDGGILTVNNTLTNALDFGSTVNSGGTLIVGDISHKSANLTGGNVTVNSGGTLSGDATVTGNVTNSGTVAALNAMSAPVSSQYLTQTTVPATNLTIEGDLTNSGKIQLAGSDIGNTLTVTGDYIGNSGTLIINTALGNDSSATDKLIVEGDTSGNTNVTVQNLHGAGAQTVKGIQVVSVDGSSDGDFKLQGRAVAGAYEYQLNKNESDGDWYLSSAKTPEPQPDPAPQLRPEVGAYLGNMTAAQSMFVNTLYDRMGDRFNGAEEDSKAAWGYINGNHTRQDSAHGALTTDTDTYAMELGGDILTASFTGKDSFNAGVMAGVGNAKTKSRAAGVKSEAHSSVDGYNVGIYSTWFADEKNKHGLYIDSWAQYGWFNNSVQGDDLDEERYDSTNQTASLESGYAFNLGSLWNAKWVLEPQGQVIYMHYQQDNHTESNGTKITDASGDGFITRLGGRLTAEFKDSVRPYTELNWWNGRPVANSVTMDGVTNGTDTPVNRYQMKVGVQGKLSSNLQVWSDLNGSLGENSYSEYGAMAGLRYQF